MVKAARMVLPLLFCGVSLTRAEADWFEERPRSVAFALGAGTYLLQLHEASAEIVLVDRVAIGAKVLLFRGTSSLPIVFPSLAVGSRRSRRSAAYAALTWAPGSGREAFMGTLGMGFEHALAARLRLYGEIGLLGGANDDFALFLPYLLTGVRVRF